jgi:cytochrome c
MQKIGLVLLLSAMSCTASAQDAGEKLFLNNCAEGHQRDGKGIPNIYPALADSEVVRGSAWTLPWYYS